MYGSSLTMLTFNPRASSMAPNEADAIPLHSDETTPPVTKTNRVMMVTADKRLVYTTPRCNAIDAKSQMGITGIDGNSGYHITPGPTIMRRHDWRLKRSWGQRPTRARGREQRPPRTTGRPATNRRRRPVRHPRTPSAPHPASREEHRATGADVVRSACTRADGLSASRRPRAVVPVKSQATVQRPNRRAATPQRRVPKECPRASAASGCASHSCGSNCGGVAGVRNTRPR